MLRKLSAMFALIFVFSALPASAAPIIYAADRTVGTGLVSFSLTTNGAVGTLAQSDITDFDITITDLTGSLRLRPTNATLLRIGSALNATLTELRFNFDAAGTNYLLVQEGGVGSGRGFYCLETVDCTSLTSISPLLNDLESLSTRGMGGIPGPPVPSFAQRSGNFVIGVAPAVPPPAIPEPATWAMMILGFGVTGAAMRRRRVGTVATA